MSEGGRYISRQVVIEAFRWDAAETVDEPDWFKKAIYDGEVIINPETNIGGSAVKRESDVAIHTKEGVITARKGDWIIQGLEGELYPCKDSIFRAKYIREEDIKE